MSQFDLRRALNLFVRRLTMVPIRRFYEIRVHVIEDSPTLRYGE